MSVNNLNDSTDRLLNILVLFLKIVITDRNEQSVYDFFCSTVFLNLLFQPFVKKHISLRMLSFKLFILLLNFYAFKWNYFYSTTLLFIQFIIMHTCIHLYFELLIVTAWMAFKKISITANKVKKKTVVFFRKRVHIKDQGTRKFLWEFRILNVAFF